MRRLLVALAMLLVAPAAAVEEADAPALWEDHFGNDMLVAAGHSPDAPAPHSQWEGFVVFADGHNVTEAQYQICRVGEVCFAPPTPASLEADGNTFRFHTADYKNPVHGEPVDYQAGWRIGVQWLVTFQGNDTQYLFPEGVPFSDPSCEGRAVECAETHYIAFHMGDEPEQESAAPSVWLMAALVAVAAALVARRDRR